MLHLNEEPLAINTDPLATLAIAAATCLYDQRDSRPKQSPLFKVS